MRAARLIEVAGFLATSKVEAACVKPEGSGKACLQMASRWWGHPALLSSPPGCSWCESQTCLARLLPRRSSPFLKPSRARLLLLLLLLKQQIKRTSVRAEGANSQAPSLRRPSSQALPPHWRLQSPRPLASGADLPRRASAWTCEFPKLRP